MNVTAWAWLALFSSSALLYLIVRLFPLRMQFAGFYRDLATWLAISMGLKAALFALFSFALLISLLH